MVVDALATRVVEPAIHDGRLPNIKRLVEAGRMIGNCVPIFPSITPAATCAIATGCYPRDSGVAGAYFYDTGEDRVYYYGDDFWTVLREGVGTFFDDFLHKLNFHLLKCETIYERVEQAGMSAACLNYLWFRGDVEHKVDVPWLLKWIPGVPTGDRIRGPKILCLGDFVCAPPKGVTSDFSSAGGPFHRFGFDDCSTAGYLIELARTTGLPDFTLAYFPDNDFQSHDSGPQKAVKTLQDFDTIVGKLIQVFGTLDDLLHQVAVVITGDHSQTDMLVDREMAAIDLERLLAEYPLVRAGEKWESDEQLMVCVNMRAAQIYLRRGYWRRLEEIVERLLADERIDQVMWREGLTDDGRTRFHVATRDRGRLTFWSRDAGAAAVADEYDGFWEWDGALNAVDGRVTEGTLTFPEYPNAFERIACAFRHDVSGDMWVTARAGFEFSASGAQYHPGGSHGALHVADSTVPLILAGGSERVDIPAPPRSVDVAPLCESLLGIVPSRPMGASHMAGRRTD